MRWRNFLGLLAFESRMLLRARALWLMLALGSLITGFGFMQAVALFAEASKPALSFPELAKGMTPLDGVLVPTFGSWYLVLTLLFPFVAIRALGQDKQSGALKLLLQLPIGEVRIILAKAPAVGVAWALSLLPPLSAVAIWLMLGGHVHAPELANLLFGYALYGLLVSGIALFAAAITESVATGAIVTLAFTLGFWVLDFAGSGSTGLVLELAHWSATAVLRDFERGLFSTPRIVGLVAASATLFGLARAWLHPGTRLAQRLVGSGIVAALAGAFILAGVSLPFHADVTEDRRLSFNPADEAALKSLPEPLVLTLYLSPEDSRLKELNANVLAKLRRLVPTLDVRYGDVGRLGAVATGGDERYGMIVYDYAGRHEESRSNSSREILPLIYGLAGITVSPAPLPDYRGYPLVADATPAGLWFYAVLPLAAALGGWFARGGFRFRIRRRSSV
ncbi:MAG: ABC transporter permease [Nitrospirae bacterium]|nr:ABC transporter permease [Nitrospirota bacterium]